MDKMKQWVALTVVGVLAVLAAGWFLLVSPKRSEAADVRTKVTAEQSKASSLQTQLAMLKTLAKNLPQQQAKLAAVAAKIPDNPALPALIRGLSAAADSAGVELTSLAPGQPAPVAAVTTAPATSARPGTAGSTGTSPTGATSAAAVGTAVAGTLQAIPLTVTVVGSYFQVEQFFDQVESLARAFKVTGFTLGQGNNPVKPPAASAPANDGRVLQASVTANVYMALGRLTTAPSTTATTPTAPVAK
jgi:type IV pilus assembly protein PilO